MVWLLIVVNDFPSCEALSLSHLSRPVWGAAASLKVK